MVGQPSTNQIRGKRPCKNAEYHLFKFSNNFVSQLFQPKPFIFAKFEDGGENLSLRPSATTNLGGAQQQVLRIFLLKILVIRANFGEFRKFWSISTSKFWKKSCDGCTPILGPISYNFDFRILSRSQSYDKPPWRNFDFLSNFEILVKIENLKSLTLAQIQILDP